MAPNEGMLQFGEFEEKFIASRLQKPLVALFLSNNMHVTKLHTYYLVTFLNQTPIFDWCVVRGRSKNKHHKRHVLKRDWIMF